MCSLLIILLYRLTLVVVMCQIKRWGMQTLYFVQQVDSYSTSKCLWFLLLLLFSIPESHIVFVCDHRQARGEEGRARLCVQNLHKEVHVSSLTRFTDKGRKSHLKLLITLKKKQKN